MSDIGILRFRVSGFGTTPRIPWIRPTGSPVSVGVGGARRGPEGPGGPKCTYSQGPFPPTSICRYCIRRLKSTYLLRVWATSMRSYRGVWWVCPDGSPRSDTLDPWTRRLNSTSFRTSILGTPGSTTIPDLHLGVPGCVGPPRISASHAVRPAAIYIISP